MVMKTEFLKISKIFKAIEFLSLYNLILLNGFFESIKKWSGYNVIRVMIMMIFSNYECANASSSKIFETEN